MSSISSWENTRQAFIEAELKRMEVSPVSLTLSGAYLAVKIHEYYRFSYRSQEIVEPEHGCLEQRRALLS